MSKIRGIVVYDITAPKFRRIIEKTLRNYGKRVQYSVFEFSLDKKIYGKMLEELKEIYNDYNLSRVKRSVKQKKKSIIIYKMNLNILESKICLDKNDVIDITDIKLII